MRSEPDAVPSTAAIAGHPIHPMLVPFPIAFLVGTLLADIAYLISDDRFWAEAARWLVGAGFVGGAAAAVFGLTDFLTIPYVRQLNLARLHFIGNALALVLALISLIIRLGNAEDAVVPTGLILSLLISGILLGTGWLGGELSYRHRIGVTPSQGEG